ncbi:ligase-associated DNA damage response DEXH box helicase [Nevskia ramosa]|uniref:ligase-associated DNA damage response DEXH box helicase n=1 Tax=Nevskia ramosa TaxID=64002 RepID=UPI0003B37F3D|nr:ligase-associated DNA damage response DEXH box helicase [Nevskia ramosa]
MPTLSHIEAWYARRRWTVFDFQRACWAAYARGESGLIHAPTGTGKTLAAWLGPLLEAESADEPIRVLWITPMRALAADTAASLQAACKELDVPWKVECRTGDTSAGARAKQRKRLPHCLVTTPESASLLLSYADLIPQWRGLRAVIVDEWHELLSTKRGVQTELVLARLRALCESATPSPVGTERPELRVWGLSATLGNLDEALAALLGSSNALPPGEGGAQRRVRARGQTYGADLPKTIAIETLIPDAVDRFPWGGHMGLPLLPKVAEVLDRAGSTLVFTNTRAQAERWFEAIQMIRPEHASALHHGSIDAAARAAVEQGLKDGSLRVVVATSSLDLGVDFSPVEQVVQIGGPKGIARLLQRAGRSGHQPGVASRIVCVPTNALELTEFAAARAAVEQRRIEPRRPLTNCLDVLAQHVVTLALTGTLTAAAIRAEIATSHAYATLPDEQWQWLLDFVMRGGALHAYPQFRKVMAREDGVLFVEDATIARRHRMSVGTITADSMMRVKFLSGAGIGQVEESFIARLKPGESFQFAGRKLTLVRVKDMAAYVKAGGNSQTIPRWAGGKMPLSSTLAASLVELLAAADPGSPPSNLRHSREGGNPVFAPSTDSPEMQALAPLLAIQRQWSQLPRPGVLLAERSKSREGEHLFVYPFAGRHVHEGLAALLAWRLSKQQKLTATLTPNDYGFELLAETLPPLDGAALKALLSPVDLDIDLPASLNAAEMARRRFREIARVSGLVFEGYPGNGKTVKQVQVSSGLLYDVLTKYDGDNLLTRQALAEVLEQQLDYRRLRLAVEAIATHDVMIVDTPRFTPFAFPLWAERIGSRLSTEDWKDRVQKMVATLEKAAAPKLRK